MPKQVSPKIHHIVVKKGKTSGRLLAYHPGVRKVNGGKAAFVPTYRLLRDNLERLRSGETVVDAKHGISMVRAATGSYKGAMNTITVKAVMGGKEFFIKMGIKTEGIRLIGAAHLADKYLKRIGHKVAGFKVEVIKPHIVYDNPRNDRTYYATDFYNQGEVIQAIDAEGPLKERLDIAIKRLKEGMEEPLGLRGIASKNAFYHPKTGTIMLFDLLH